MRKTGAALIMAFLVTAAAGTFLVRLGVANPNPFGIPHYVVSEGSPDSQTDPPGISIRSPLNGTTFPSSNLSLNYNVSVGDSETASVRFIWNITIEGDWLPNNITAYEFNADKNPYTTEPTITQFYRTLNFTGIPEGKHNLLVHAWERGAYENNEYTSGFVTKVYVNNFFIEGSSSLAFTIDTIAPKVSILSLENKTSSSNTRNVLLNFSVNEEFSKLTYSLDGKDNVTISENVTLADSPAGSHNVTVYATDLAGHVGKSETVTFSVVEPETFPTVPVAAISGASIAAVIAAGLLLYNKKRRKEAQQT